MGPKAPDGSTITPAPSTCAQIHRCPATPGTQRTINEPVEFRHRYKFCHYFLTLMTVQNTDLYNDWISKLLTVGEATRSVRAAILLLPTGKNLDLKSPDLKSISNTGLDFRICMQINLYSRCYLQCYGLFRKDRHKRYTEIVKGLIGCPFSTS